MKIISWIVLVALVILLVWGISAEVFADYEYSNGIGSFWSLSEKASSLELKSAYLDKFVIAIEQSRLSGNDAIFLKTPDNSIEQNMNVLHSLQQRMHEIKGMDVTSFAYQQAISQITAQEQGEGSHMLDVIEGRWYLDNHPMLWGWIDLVKWLIWLVSFVVDIGVFSVVYDWNY